MKKLTVVIPNRIGEKPDLTLKTLYQQSFTDFDIIIINDRSGNANVARNEGLSMVESPLVLFSDNDINWAPDALQLMYDCLQYNPDVSYAYGAYELNGKIWCNREWDPNELRRRNFVSTMTMMYTADHPGWDESLKRLQDWDIWLTRLKQGKKGKYVGRQIFSTPVRNGITRSGISLDEARRAIALKHRLTL